MNQREGVALDDMFEDGEAGLDNMFEGEGGGLDDRRQDRHYYPL